MKMRKSWRRRYRKRNQITTKPLIGGCDEPPEELGAVSLEPVLQHPDTLVQAGARDDRDRQQEREAGRGLPFDADGARGGDRHAGARHPGLQRQRLGEPQEQARLGPDGVQIAIASADPVDDVEDHPEDREHHGDQPRLTERVLDRALEQRSRDRPGDRADHERPSESFVRRADRTSSDRRDPCLEVAPEIDAEIDHGPHQRPDVERDVEGLVERRILDDGPPE